jgi:5-methylcytosine-specific restriction endonuclease McrA
MYSYIKSSEFLKDFCMLWIKRKLCACGCGQIVWDLRSSSVIGHIRRSGTQCHLYIDGRTKKLKEWTKIVYERDKYTCQHCFGKRGYKRLRAHHIKPKEEFPELIYDVDNGITLCIGCHNTVHNLGKKRSEETKDKLSIAKLGSKNPLYGKSSAMKDRTTSVETRQKQSNSRSAYFQRVREFNERKRLPIKKLIGVA